MTAFHVAPDVHPELAIYSPRLGRTIRFEDGRYDTTDPAEVVLLRRHQSVVDLDELESDLTTPDAPEGVDEEKVDEDLAALRDEDDEE